MKKKLNFGLIAAAGFIAASVAAFQGQPAAHAMGKPVWEKLLHVPSENYRTDWVLLGSFSVQADNPEDGAKELHVVYTKQENIDAWKKNGKFPDGAVLVKDVFATKTEVLPTGVASYANELAGRFVMVKDSTNQYAEKSKLWGDGWGWAFYEGQETVKTVSTDYNVDCMDCHIPATQTDFNFVQGYPILHSK